MLCHASLQLTPYCRLILAQQRPQDPCGTDVRIPIYTVVVILQLQPLFPSEMAMP